LTLQFVNLIVRNRRELLLADIVRNFIDLYEKLKGIKRAHLTSATGIDDSSKQQMQQQLNVLFNADVQLSVETNPDLIGGLILRVGDQQYDASLSSALKRMRKTMTV
jgi:F-type H+-transporting ATPase subunit delta